MFANCSQEVNEVRSQFQGSLAIKGKPRKVFVRDANPEKMPEMAKKFRKKKSKDEPQSEILANDFIRIAPVEIGIATCRERVFQSVLMWVVAGILKKKRYI